MTKVKLPHRIFCSYRTPGFFWFRLFWVFGVVVSDTNQHRLTFSERWAHEGIQVSHYRIRWVKVWRFNSWFLERRLKRGVHEAR